MHDLWANDLAPLIFVAFFGAVGTLLYPLMQGLRRRIEGDGGEDVKRLRAEVDALRAEVEQLHDSHAAGASHERLLDLEERLDFAERLIAGGREPLTGGP
jgi:hypothetical protein